MRTRTLTALLVALATAGAFLAAPGPAHAVSVGVYGTLGGGSVDWSGSGEPAYWNVDESRDTRHGGAGLVLDTAVPYAPLSYRLSVGWERVTHEDRLGSPGLEMEGVVVDQDLSLHLLGGPGPLRLRIGPELRFAFLNTTADGVAGDEDYLGIGLGPVLGLDFDLSPGVMLSWKFGVLYTSYSGRGSDESLDDASLDEAHAYASLAILFSTGGAPQYQQRQPQYPPQPPQYQPPQYQPPPPPGGYDPQRW